MPRLPTVNARKMIKVLKKKGFELDAVDGNHQTYRHPETGLRTVVPFHSRKDLGRGLTLSILKDVRISRDEFIKLV